MIDAKNVQVLLVEDDQFSRMILGELFRIMDVKHDAASDGKEALGLAEKKDYDLILMDLAMPVMDGYSATRKIRELPGYHDTTIIALTADISEKVKAEVNSGLFSGYSLKPIEPDDLQQKITEIAKNKL
jgi:two-component system, sensor histidine kinase and response regulator